MFNTLIFFFFHIEAIWDTVSLTIHNLQAMCGARKMNFSATENGACRQSSCATVLTTAVTEAMRLLATTAQLVSSPVGHRTSVCQKTRSVMDRSTAQTNGMRPGSCAVQPLEHTWRARRQSFSVLMESAYGRRRGAITGQIAPMAVMKRVVVSAAMWLHVLLKMYNSPKKTSFLNFLFIYFFLALICWQWVTGTLSNQSCGDNELMLSKSHHINIWIHGLYISF